MDPDRRVCKISTEEKKGMPTEPQSVCSGYTYLWLYSSLYANMSGIALV